MPKILRYAKFAELPAFDLASALPTPEFTQDIASSSIDVPSDTELIWEGGIGRGRRSHAPGYYNVPGNVVIPTDIHTLPWLLKWTLGGYTFTDVTDGLNIHELYAVHERELFPFVTWLGKDVFEQIVRACTASQLTIEVSDGYAQATLEQVGAKDEKGTLDQQILDELPLPPNLTFPAFRFWVGGTASGDERSAKIRSLTLTINNNTDASQARGLGSRYPQRIIPAGQRDITVSFTTYYDSAEHVERVWGQASGPSDDGSTELPLQIKADAGSHGSLTASLPRVVFNEVQTQPSGRSEIEQTVTAQALLDTITLNDGVTDVESEILATATNDRAEMTA